MERRRGRERGLLVVLAVVQLVYLGVAGRQLLAHGWPVVGEGRVNPYLAHFAVQVVTFPLAILGVPVLFTLAVSRRRLTARSLDLLVEGWRNMLLLTPAVALGFKLFFEGSVGQVTFRSDRPLFVLVGQGLLYLLVADLWFYLTHRALHSRALYRFHVDHHLHQAPTEALAFFAVSPFEVVLSGLLLVFVPALIVPVHAAALGAANLVILAAGLYIHESTLVATTPLPGFNGPAEHQRHHQHGRRNQNYGLVLTAFDRLFGTRRVD
jgi:sterol desaturase/sphingolipid hydroxylase (fatty acid hydroxylase superfamily)